MKRGWEKFERFIKNLFWYIGFFLTHFDLTFSLILMFLLASIVWLLLAMITIPGVSYVAWACYWYVPASVKLAIHILYLTFYILKGASLAALEFLVRLVTGGVWSLEFLSGSSECHAQLGTWHARDPTNAFKKLAFGCKLPCRTGFSAGERSALCTVDPLWRPSMCPQQQIHRLARKVGGIGTPATLDGSARYVSTSSNLAEAKQTKTIEMELDAHKKRMGFIQSCMQNPKLTPYNAHAKSLCMHNNTIQSSALSAVCKAAYCLREDRDPKDAWVCSKFDNASMESKDDTGNRNVRMIILIVTVILIMICMGLFTVLSPP
jgi:hypothetical protein